MKRIIDNFSKEEFQSIIEQCDNFHETTIKLGYSKNTNVKQLIIQKCKEFNISYEHLLQNEKINRILTKEIVFCLDSTVSQASLRRWYKKENQEYKCSICGQNDIWNGKPLSLTLDHINGNNTDNRLENLRWICPNCDRQLPTYGSKNIPNRQKQIIKTKNYCIDCGKEISYGSVRCVSCCGKYHRLIERPSKEELFQILYDNKGNFTKVGKLFGVTDNAIRKWAKNYQLSSYSKDYK